MNLLKWNLFRGGIFKQAKFLFSVPQSAQKVLYISEAGTISQEILPMHTGYISSTIKRAWIVLHNLKFTVHKKGELAQDEQVLLISERSYIPLDPNESMKSKDRERLTSLKEIARLRHAEKRADMGRDVGKVDLAQTIITGGYITLVLMLLVHLIQNWGGK